MLTGLTQMFLTEDSTLDGSLFDPEYKLFLAFLLDQEFYGIAIESIVEVKSWRDVKIRPLVKAPSFLLGVFNLRGNIVPVVDLRIKWDCTETLYDERTAVIIMTIEKRLWAVVVDRIKEVAGLKKDQISPAPMLNAKLDIRYFLGLATRDDYNIMLLDIERVMTSQEMGLIEQAETMELS